MTSATIFAGRCTIPRCIPLKHRHMPLNVPQHLSLFGPPVMVGDLVQLRGMFIGIWSMRSG
mgnify:CR=1 FL=1